MLDLPNLRSVLAQILEPPSVHTAALFTTTGQLVSFVSTEYSTAYHLPVNADEG